MTTYDKIETGDLVYSADFNILGIFIQSCSGVAWIDEGLVFMFPYIYDELTLISKGDFK